MKTIKEISKLLQQTSDPEPWMKTLEEDHRSGVKSELQRWYRNYEKKLQLEQMLQDKISFDASYKPFAGALVAGVDEAGRGPLAGPVVCAAVILPDEASQLLGLNDSKKLSIQERGRLSTIIKEIAISYSIHIQSAERIDEINIYAATKESMETAVGNLEIRPNIVLADAMKLQIECRTESIVKGDAQSLAIAAASILAKTTRDQWMEELHEEFPMYNFKKNAGYGTEEHVEALHVHGPCEHHRRTFEPVKSILERR
ncbi:ribonuclease HII [Sporosarcina sp. ACRSL]|uniref:ribonuclease HII n=1 Tax=Sporosarcina sp. ACRSL TaxID=2918215 RepID=UPI001EF59402|nr:ribonuclease HII [Sporosarcina sp. ACRSL]MCG7342851.1 ribonuclease HII [Sporosarcina sp. ACRSL]